MTDYFAKDRSAELRRSEVLFAEFVCKNNLPFTIGDSFTRIVGQMFPDSHIAKKFASGKTKTTQVVKGMYKSVFQFSIYVQEE